MMQLVKAALVAAPLSYDNSATEAIAKQDVRWYG
jgi:hypothetical protein